MEWWISLPAGILIGWILAEKLYLKKQNGSISREYFKGLSYIINEEQDKAISVFTKMLADRPETIETQIALGALFRRRGESAKAISIHKNLIDSDTLNHSQKKETLLELGRDYMRAGILDRAIEPFNILLSYHEHREEALLFLSQIYDQEKDWDKAIEIIDKLYQISKDNKWKVIHSHYWCEKALLKIKTKEFKTADIFLNNALKENPSCARANIIKAKSLQIQEKHQEALVIFKQIENQEPKHIPEILTPMLTSYHKVASPEEVMKYMQQLLNRNPSTSLIITLTNTIKSISGSKEAELTLIKALQNRPSVRGLELLISFNLDKEDNNKNRKKLQSLQLMMSKLQEEKATYKCNNCGFEAQELHWQCPSCRNWSTIEPITGVSGE